MKRKQPAAGPTTVRVGYATDESGHGVAYAAVHGANGPTLERISFTVRRQDALRRREAGYAALDALARQILANGEQAVRLEVDDETLVTDLTERRTLPQALTLPYVALRCSLNRFAAADVVQAPSAETADLKARALAEASLLIAA